MSAKPEDNPQDETTHLHLNQFAPGQETAGPAGAEEGMTVFIKKAAKQATQDAQQPVVKPKDAGVLSPKEMLGAVSYCYAKGVYQSEEIERKMQQDEGLKAATGGELPDAKAIRRFRKLNRDAICDTLEKAFRSRRKKAAAPQPPLAESAPVAPPPNPSGPTSDGAGEQTVFISRQQAQAQLDKASFVDNMMKEE